MKIDIIKDILMLREQQGYNIFNLGIKKDNKLSFVFNGDVNFSDIYVDFLDELNVLTMKLFHMFKEEISKNLEKLDDKKQLNLSGFEGEYAHLNPK